jgi:hypothetical protein
MRKLILNRRGIIPLVMTLTLFQYCRKSDISRFQTDDLSHQAETYFNTNVLDHLPSYKAGNPYNDRTQRTKKVLWDGTAIVIFRDRPAVLAPVQFERDLFVTSDWGGKNSFRLDNCEKLLMYKDVSQVWHTELVTFLPDTSFLLSDHQERFSGMVLVDDWWGNPLDKYRFLTDGSVWRYVPEQGLTDTGKPGPIAASVRPSILIQTCYSINGYNYSPSDAAGGTYWTQFIGCTQMFIPDRLESGGGAYGGLGGSGGGSGIGKPSLPVTALSPLIYRPLKIIANLQDYFKCFGDVPGATYQVTLCVDQPKPGTRTPWVLKDDGSSGSIDPFNVGHTFLILTENMPGGWSITRNIGFYPSKDVTPYSSSVPGVLNNDDQAQYNIGASFSMSNTLFYAMLASVPNISTNYYQANTYNCTNFVLSVLESGHIYLPHTIGSWIGGTGVDPGDLGEDIRSHSYNGMNRMTTPTIHPNVGNCD